MGETNFDRVDAYVNTAADYDEVPDMADADPALVTWSVGGEPVTEAEGRNAMAEAGSRRGRPPVAGGKVQLALRVDRDVVELFKADGAGWHGRMNAALRKAVGLR